MLFLIDNLLEAGEVGRIAGAHGAIFVARDETLELEGDEAGHAVGLVARDEAADGFGGRGAAAEVVVVFVEVVAAGVRGVGFPVVGGPAIATRAIEGEMRRRIRDARVEIEAVDVGRNGMGVAGIDGDGDIRLGAGRRGRGLRGGIAFAGRIHGGDDVIVGRAVGQAGVGVAGSGG